MPHNPFKIKNEKFTFFPICKVKYEQFCTQFKAGKDRIIALRKELGIK